MKNSCIFVPRILLPQPDADMTAWAVIACDQHTSDRAYWSALDALVGDKPSTLRLTLPEVYLEDADCPARIAKIAETMRDYRARGVFRTLPPGFVLVQRTAPGMPVRTGIVLAVDLEAYSFEKQSDALIRATEATILERIPPRLKIREAADIEFPHILLLYEDMQGAVAAAARSHRSGALYDFALNMGGGRIRGDFIADVQPVLDAFAGLVRDGLLFMVGDGNHSLATAKAAWERCKAGLSEAERAVHPARFALCEAVNIYDQGIRFEAIHRLVKGVDPDDFARGLRPFGRAEGGLCVHGRKIPLGVAEEVPAAVAAVDAYIDEYMLRKGGSVDFVHGEEAVRAYTEEHPDSAGILLPAMEKSSLFGLVKRGGSLPRKTFSMGESEEKRYYVEGKEIRA